MVFSFCSSRCHAGIFPNFFRGSYARKAKDSLGRVFIHAFHARGGVARGFGD